MIVSSYQGVEKSLYIIGSNIIKIMKEYQFNEIGLPMLYAKYKEQSGAISLSYLVYSLDWLYIANIVSLSPTGNIKLCN